MSVEQRKKIAFIFLHENTNIRCEFEHQPDTKNKQTPTYIFCPSKPGAVKKKKKKRIALANFVILITDKKKTD